jgi:hypothetical protein
MHKVDVADSPDARGNECGTNAGSGPTSRAADRFARKIVGFLKSLYAARLRRLKPKPLGGASTPPCLALHRAVLPI